MVAGVFAAGCDGSLNDDVLPMEGSLAIAPSDGTSTLSAEIDGFDGGDLHARLAKEDISPEMSDWNAWETLSYDTITLSLSEGAKGNLDLVDSIEVYETRPNQKDVLVGTAGHVPRGVKSVTLEMTGADITPEVLDVDSKLRVDVHGNGAPDATKLSVDAELHIDWPDDVSCNPGPEIL